MRTVGSKFDRFAKHDPLVASDVDKAGVRAQDTTHDFKRLIVIEIALIAG
jgi:hypothetical protein